MEGVIDYYTTPVLVLENGQMVEKEPLTGTETVTFEALGELRGVLHGGGDLVHAVPLSGPGLVDVVQDASLPGTRCTHEGDAGPRAHGAL